ncbi:unnamed protein product [Closterium sp. NIES-54]
MPPKGSRAKAVVDAPAGGGDPASKSTPGKGTEVVDNLPAEAEVTAGVSGLTIEEKLQALAATVVSDDSDEELEIDTTKSTHPHLRFMAILLFPVIPSREVSFLHESDAVKIKQTAVEHKRQNGLTLHCFWLHQEDAAYLRTKASGPHLLEVYFKDVPADIPPELVKEVMVTHPLRMRKQSAFAEGHYFHRVLHPVTGADTDRIKGLVVQHAGDKHRWRHEFRHQLLGGTALLAHYPLLSCPLCGGHHYDKFHNVFITERQNIIGKWSLTVVTDAPLSPCSFFSPHFSAYHSVTAGCGFRGDLHWEQSGGMAVYSRELRKDPWQVLYGCSGSHYVGKPSAGLGEVGCGHSQLPGEAWSARHPKGVPDLSYLPACRKQSRVAMAFSLGSVVRQADSCGVCFEFLISRLNTALQVYAKEERKRVRATMSHLHQSVAELKHAWLGDPGCARLKSLLAEREAQLKGYQLARQERLHGMARMKEEVLGEVASPHLSAKIKARKGQTQITELNAGGKLVKDNGAILGAASQYYRVLFGCDRQQVESACSPALGRSLSRKSAEAVCMAWSEEEVQNAFRSMAKDKAPGKDGLPKELFELHWDILGKHFMQLARNFAATAMLPTSTKDAVTILLHKKGGRDQLENYRPVTLLNFTYKVIARVVADRMKKMLHEVISWKAFDSVSRGFLFTVLERMGFPSLFVDWVRGLHKDTRTSLLINGWMGEAIDVVSGVRQGCPLAPYLFLCAVEPLAQQAAVRNLGLERGYRRLAYLGYADDTTLILQGEEQITEAERLLADFEAESGLATNKEKSSILPLGRNLNKQACKTDGFKWVKADEAERLLGVWVTPAGSCTPTWEKAFARIKEKPRQWETQHLTTDARVAVINCYISPINFFQAQVYPPPVDIWGRILKLVHNFVSGNHAVTDKKFILWSRELLYMARGDGGVGVRDPEIELTCLAARRIGLLLTETCVLKRDIMLEAADLPLGTDTFVAHVKLLKSWRGKSERWKLACGSFMQSPLVESLPDLTREEIEAERIVFNRNILLNAAVAARAARAAESPSRSCRRAARAAEPQLLPSRRAAEPPEPPAPPVAESPSLIFPPLVSPCLASAMPAACLPGCLPYYCYSCSCFYWRSQMQPQQRARESLTPQQLREWYAGWGCRGGGAATATTTAATTTAGGKMQLQRRPRTSLTPQQLREWYAQSRGSLSSVHCSYVIRTGARTGQPCGTPSHTQSSCFARLSDAWRTEFGNEAELPDWVELLRQRVDIFYLDYDAILTAMYALPTSADRAGHLCVPPDPGIEPAALAASEAAALGASESPAPGTGAAAALGASESASSGAGESALSGTASASASHTFTLDSGPSRSFFRDRTTLTPLGRPVAVSLADPSGGPVLAHFSTVLPCPAAPSGTLSGLYLPSFSTNLVSGADLQDAGVHQFTPASQRVTHCTDARTGRHLATFTRRPGSSLYTLTTASPPATASGQVAASGQVFAAASRSGPESAPCSCRLLSHETLLWHHRLGHPSLLHLRSMASRVLVSGLPRSLPPLPSGPGPTCVPCVEERQRAAPHSSQFPPTEAPLQTLHMDVWGPAHVRGQGHERYFLLVVDDYSRYTTVFPLRSKGDVTEVLIDWIRAARLQLRRSFGSDFPVLRLHSDRGGEFSSGLLRAYCRERGIRQTFTLPESPQQNGIAERRIGMVMDVARTSMMHAAAPHFLWPFAVRYAAHQINLQPRVSMPETSPALLWTGKVGDASAFRVWGSRAFVRDLSADKLSPRAAPCGPAPSGVSQVDAVEPVEVAGDSGAAEGAEPGGADSGGAEPGGATPGGVEPGGAEPDGAGPARVASGGAVPGGTPGASSRREPLSPPELREWFARRWRRAAGAGGAADTGGSTAAESPGAADPGGARTGSTGAAGPAGTSGAGAAAGVGAEAIAVGPGGGPAGGAPGAAGGTGAGGAAGAGAELGGATPGGSPGASSLREPLSPQELCEWFARRWSLAAGAGGSSATEGAAVVGPGGARTVSTRAAGTAGSTGASAAEGVGAETTAGGPAGGTPGVAGGSGAAGGAAGAGAPAGGPGAVPAVSGVAARPRPYFVPLLQQVLGLSPSTGPPAPLECPQPVPSQLQLQPASPLPAPSPYTGPTGGLAERREPASRPASPVRAARTSGRGSRQRPPPLPGTHRMSLRPSTVPLRAPLPSPPASSLPALADPESDSLRAASPTVTRLLATVVTDPSFESTAASALVAELVDFPACCRLDYAASLVAESESVCPPSVGGECALGMDVLEDSQEEFQCLAAASPHVVSVLLTPEGDPDALDIPTPRSYAEAIEGPYSSQWQAAMDTEMASWKSTGTYVDEVPPPGANIVSGMWIRVKRPPGSPPVFKARYVARGFSQRQGVDYFQTFSPTPKMTTLRVLLHVAAHRDYELHSLDFSTAFLQGSLHEEIWLRRPPGFTGSFPPGTQWSLRRPVYGLRQAPREWHDTVRTTLAALGFAPSTADPSLFLRTDTSLPPFYILVYVDDLVFATADTAGLAYVKSELQKRHTCTDLGELRSYLGLQITRDRARRTITLTQSHMVQQVLQRFGFTYSSPQATPLPTRHSLSALPSDESVESSGPYPELVGCLMYLMTCTRLDLAYPLSILARYVAPGRHRPEHMAATKRVLRYLCSTSGLGLVLGGRSPVVLTGHADASWADDQATQRSSQGYTFSLGSGSVSWRATRSSSVLGSSCEAEIYAGAMAAQELRWLTYLLTNLGEPPRSPPILYVDNKAMLALCRELRQEHRTKHIALRYFLARELQQRGHLLLAYVASEANTADVFTKALAPCYHQRFCTQLGLVPVLPHLLTS